MNRITATLLCLMLCLAGTSLHATAFAAEQTTVATPPTTPTTPITLPATPAQVVALKTPVVPPPLIRPFPAPVTTRTVTVPGTIDATGTTNVCTALTAFIAGVPNGTTINFPSAGIYRIDSAIEFEGRHNLIFDGNGCTLKYTSITGTDQGHSLWYNWHNEVRGSDIWIKNFVLIGSSPYPGVFTPGDSPAGGQEQHGVVVCSDRFEVSGCTISTVWGDGVIVCTGASGVWIHDNHVISAGRQGVSVISATNVIVERNAFDAVGGSGLDVEPDESTDACINVIFRNNTIGTYGTPGSGFDPYAFNVSNHAEITIDGIVIDGNIVTGGSIATYVDGYDVRLKHITFTNNVGKATAAGSVLYFKYIDGLTVTGNVQPLSSGGLTRITDCTGAR